MINSLAEASCCPAAGGRTLDSTVKKKVLRVSHNNTENKQAAKKTTESPPNTDTTEIDILYLVLHFRIGYESHIKVRNPIKTIERKNLER